MQKKLLLKIGIPIMIGILAVTGLLIPSAFAFPFEDECPLDGVQVPECPTRTKDDPFGDLSIRFFPHPHDCHWFFYCSDGNAYCRKCPAGLHWNVDLDVCDWPHDAGCEL